MGRVIFREFGVFFMDRPPIAYVQRQPEGAESPIFEQDCALPDGFVYLDEAIPGVLWDAKYASEDNFTGAPVDGYQANRIACSQKMIPALEAARELAAGQGCLLLVWDAARPQRAVDAFARWADQLEDGKTQETHYPKLSRGQLFSQGYIARRSGHSRGAAVDLTLVSIESGLELDMGGIFDLMDKKSHHGAKGLTAQQRANRKALRSIMERSGFSAYSNEWWHYSLNVEPFPGQYFDFIIGGTVRDDEADGGVMPANPMEGKRRDG